MRTFLVKGQQYTIAQYIQCFQPRATIEAAVLHPLYTPQERQEMIERHNARIWKATVKRLFGSWEG